MIEDETRIAGQTTSVGRIETAGARRVTVDAVSESVHDEAVGADASTVDKRSSRLAGETTGRRAVVRQTSGASNGTSRADTIGAESKSAAGRTVAGSGVASAGDVQDGGGVAGETLVRGRAGAGTTGGVTLLAVTVGVHVHAGLTKTGVTGLKNGVGLAGPAVVVGGVGALSALVVARLTVA